MKCDHCGSSEVTAKVMVQKDNGTEELNLCNSCFQKFIADNPEIKEKGIGLDLSKFAGILMNSLTKPISEMINKNSNLINPGNFGKTSINKSKNDLICSKCKTTEKSLRVSGKPGCEYCYQIFKKLIDKKLLELCGENSETMNYTKSITDEEKIKVLSVELDEAIEAEEFELAAQIRDDIKFLKKNC